MQDKIKKTRSKKDLIISLLFLLTGVAMCFSSDSSVLICGIVFIIIGIAALIAMKTSFKIDGDDTVYQCKIDFIMPDGGATLMEGDQMLILESYSQNET